MFCEIVSDIDKDPNTLNPVPATAVPVCVCANTPPVVLTL